MRRKPEEHGSVIRGGARARRSHASIALSVPPVPPTHRRVVKQQRGPRTVGDRERLVLALLEARPGTYAKDLAAASGLTVGQVRYSLGILRENRLVGRARGDEGTVWVATR